MVIQKILKIKLSDRITNTDALRRIGEERKLWKNFSKKKMN